MNSMIEDYEVKFNYDDFNTEIKVIYNGEVVFTWYDGANVDFPEDLCWSRDIGGVFDAGVELGKKIANDRIKSLTAERDEYKAALRDLWEWIRETEGDLDRECFLDAITKTQWSARGFPSFKGYPEHRETIERFGS